MFKEKRQRLTALVMALMIGLGIIFPTSEVLAAPPAKLDAKVEVTGISEDGVIDSSKPIKIKVDFKVPVKGDVGEPEVRFEYDDTVVLPLSTSFVFSGTLDNISLKHEGKPLGTVTLSNEVKDGVSQAIATIKFDGDKDIFDPKLVAKTDNDGRPYANVSGSFDATLIYNGAHNDEGVENKIVSILNKTYNLHIVENIITYSLEKSGVVNADDTITWTVVVTGTKGTTPIDLGGYVFEDDLDKVGEYVPDSFEPKSGTLVPPLGENTKLTYTFPDDATSPQTVSFRTKIPLETLTNGGDISNTARLLLDDKEVAISNTSTQTIATPSATKHGVASDKGAGADIVKNRTITWYIDVDNKGRPLNNLTITDVLKDGLTLQSAQWQRWKGLVDYDATTTAKEDVNWEDVSDSAWDAVHSGNEYVIGDVNYIGRLVMVTKVPDDVGSTVAAKTYYNQATVTWGTTGKAETGESGVTIGYDALSKQGAQVDDDVEKHQITWTLKVDLKGQTDTTFTVYDLFVHSASTLNADLTGAGGWPAGLVIGSSGVTRNNGQKLVDVSYDDHLTVTTIELKKADGTLIGTLVQITVLKNTGNNQVVIKSQVLDPDILAGNNAGQRVSNTAGLFKGNTRRIEKSASVLFDNKILSKELLNRGQVANDYSDGVQINPNDRTTNAADGFHYGHKEVIFRLNINAAELDFKDVETTLSGGFGDVTVTDTLPAGWEFKTFSGKKDYLIYAANGSLVASGNPLESVAGLTPVFNKGTNPQTATFTFTDLDQPYVILVKAGPTMDTFDGYLTGADTREETNTLTPNTVNWTPGKTVTQKVRVDSKVLDKRFNINETEGSLTWTVDYTPFNRVIGTGIEDTLPQGIDLRTDSSGQLIWEQDGTRNINVYPLTLKADGSSEYEQGAELTLEEIQKAVSYNNTTNNTTRVLTFVFPNKDRAYRLTYVTDITGAAGKIQNTVRLVDAAGKGTHTGKDFVIQEQHGEATMGRSGYLVVKKTDINAQPLPGAEFTLHNTNADGSKGSARAVRTTGADGTVRFYGLVPGRYILAETQVPKDYVNPGLEYDILVNNEKETTANGSSIITSTTPFTIVNYKPEDAVGSLTIGKAVAGNKADAEKSFSFTLTLSNANGTYDYVGKGVPGGTIQNNGKFSLAHGQSITITGLPAGAAYEVVEDDYSVEGYTTASTGATGTIEKNAVHTASFTNKKNVFPIDPPDQTGALTISKVAVGAGADTQKEFLFTVTFTGAPGTYPYTGKGVKDGTVKSGDTLALASGTSITITDLPAGAKYQVVEDQAVAHGYLSESEGSTGTVSDTQESWAAFTNTKLPETTGSLTITKTVTGEGADRSKRFDFTVTLTDAPDAYAYTGAATGNLRSGDVISLADGESITITGLPVGAGYTVTEADYTAEGYTVTATGETGLIAAGATETAAFANGWTAVPEVPVTPEKPGTPGDPGAPEDPTHNIDDGDIPRGSMDGKGEESDPTADIGDGDIPRGSMDGKKDGMPKTGDSQSGGIAKLALILFSMVLAVLVIVDFSLRKRYAGKRMSK